MRVGVFGLILLVRAAAWAQGFEPMFIQNPPALNGKLDEAAWMQAPALADFLQRFPREGALPTERTEVKILYTNDALYIGFRAYDSRPDRIEASVMRRDDDALVNNDQFAMAIDSHNDGRSGFWFSTNPLGARVDAQFFDEGDLWEPNWNGIWECRTTIDDQGWTAEIEIPFSTLRFQESSDTVMGINFFRRIIRTNESLFYPLIPLSYSNGTPNVSVAEKYHFHGIRSGKALQIKPYLLSGLHRVTGLNADARAKAGLDLLYPLTAALTSYVSLNTDFAEAEADELQVNLTRYPLFFPEKREFFLENAGDFSFGVPQDTELFFSRRIGLSETGEAVPVLFGARAAGKVRAFDLGFLNVQTREDGMIAAENFSAARIRASVAPRSYIGAIYTGRTGSGIFQGSVGGDFLFYAGNNISVTGFAATVLENHSTNNPAAYYISTGRGGEATAFHVSYLDVAKGFDPAIGFVRRTDIRTWSADGAVPRYWNTHGIRNLTPGVQANLTYDHSGLLLDTAQKVYLDVVLQSEDKLSFFVQHSEEFVSEPFDVFQQVSIPAARYLQNRGGMVISTKEGRPLAASVTLSAGGFYGGSLREIAPSLVYRANRHIQFTQSLSANSAKRPESTFRALLSRSRIDWCLDTKLSASAVVQYDNDLQQTALNLRITYLFREGTELFVVFDQGDDLAGDHRLQRRLLMKFTYLF